MTPIVSIIIPCFNAALWIRDALSSVDAQRIRDIEVIVVDDGSTDMSPQIVKDCYPQVKLINSDHKGPSSARNIGTAVSKGEFIQYLDADDMLAPGKIVRQLEAFESDDADIAYGAWQKLVKSPKGEFIKGEIIKRKIQDLEIDLFTDFWCPPVTYLFRRAIVIKTGGWNEKLPIIQDARFVLDCALQGGKFVYCDEIMGYYRLHSFDTVSHRDPIGFTRDCLRNAIEVEAWWRCHGGINNERKNALLKVYGAIARGSFENDQSVFNTTLNALLSLQLPYVPSKPKMLKIISRFFGYRNAEKIAFWFRCIKKIISSNSAQRNLYGFGK